jgi:hypothetical protein
MASQDDIRENAQKELFGVSDYSDTGRGNGYTPDGKKTIGGKDFSIEFKTKPEYGINNTTGKRVNKSGFSTARQFGNKKVEDWREQVDVFVFSEFEGADFNGNFTRHVALSFDDLYPILEDKVLKPYNEGRAPSKRSSGYYGVGEFEKNVLPHLGHLSPEDIKRITHTIEVGTSLNDPKFSIKDLLAHGTMIESEEDLSVFCEGLLSRD